MKFYVSPLHLAVEKGNIEIIQLLLNHKNIDANIKNDVFTFFKTVFIYKFMVLFYFFHG